MIHVAVGVIINAAGEVLIAQRASHDTQAGLWEFPGGKLELNETPFAALQRELQEEVAIHVVSAEPWLQIEYDYSDRKVFLDTWRVIEFTGEPRGAEGQPIRWVMPAQLIQFQFPAGNKLIIEKLCLL